MYNPDTEILFPLRVIAQLKTMRGDGWNQFIDRVSSAEASMAEKTALVLMMVKMGGCVSCNSDSFRAMRGCTMCARQTIKRYRGSDEELIEQHRLLQKDVEQFLKKQAYLVNE
jgi:hypothetical protein